MLEVGVSETSWEKERRSTTRRRWTLDDAAAEDKYHLRSPMNWGPGGSLRAGYGYCDIPLLRGKGAVLFSRWAHVAASVGSSGVQEWRRQMLPLQAKDSAMIIRFGWHLRVGYGLRREAMRYGFRQLIFTILDSWNYYHVRGLLAVCIGAVINWITLPYIISSSLRTR